MIKIANMTPKIPRGTIIGKQTGGPPLSEAEQFCVKPAAVGLICGIFVPVLEDEEPLPDPACDQGR
jgi:hypothetical protein